MQRIPANNIPNHSAGASPEPSPLLRLARRIREEQGAEQTRAFLTAMLPFAAPGEIRRIGEGFGIPFESIQSAASQMHPQPKQPANGGNTMNQLQLLQTLMQMKNAVQGGVPDINKLMSLFGPQR